RKQHSIAAVLHRKQHRIAPVLLRRKRNQLQCKGKSRESRRAVPQRARDVLTRSPRGIRNSAAGHNCARGTNSQSETAEVCCAHKSVLTDRAFMFAFFLQAHSPQKNSRLENNVVLSAACFGEDQSGPGASQSRNKGR